MPAQFVVDVKIGRGVQPMYLGNVLLHLGRTPAAAPRGHLSA